MKNVLIVELNEFNVDLLQSAIQQYTLPSLAKVLAFPHTQYRTPDRYNSGFLEPWVQWVSIHAGIPSSSHQIKHLGDVPDLSFAQCWETLSKHEITTGVWGVMNGARRGSKHTLFFVPDPWTFSEVAHPSSLNHLLELPRYVSKHYQTLKKSTLLKKGFQLFAFLLTSGISLAFLRETATLLSHLYRYGSKHFVFICYFEMLSALLFIHYKAKYQPRCAFLFLNSLAHLQHHYWCKGTQTVTPEILFGLRMIDRLLGLLFKHFPQDALVVHNGLSQMNTNHEKPWVLYRQKDPLRFLKALKIPATHVEQHMTHDGHVFFRSALDCEKAYENLRKATLQGKPLFHVERNAHDPCKLFYQLKFTDQIENESTTFAYNGGSYLFFKYFDNIVTRTGRHIPIGTIYSDTVCFPNHIYNHEFNQFVFYYLAPQHFPLEEEQEKEEIVCP